MPPAALPAIGLATGALGTGTSAAGGKKAGNRANDLAQQQLNLQQQQFGLSKQAFQPALGYWTDLLKGGQAATEATGPYASMISQQAQGQRNQIMQNTPRGGEQNLALTESQNNQSNDMARLWAGMQPQAAGALANMATGVMPSANTGAAAGIYGQQMQNSMQAGQGFGNLLYNSSQKKRGKA